jgi:hypothetical protein
MAHKTDVDQDAEISRLRATVREWRVEAARQGRTLRLPVMPLLLRNIWTGAMLLFSLLMFMTFFVTTVFQVLRFSMASKPLTYNPDRQQFLSVSLGFVGPWQCGFPLQ